MARFKTLCIPLGSHISPDGTVHATPMRVRRWADTFKRMSASGVKIPLAWGHQPGAFPVENEADYQRAMSQYNAGYVTNLMAGDGGLWMEGEAPGVEVDEHGNLIHWARLPDGREVKGSIGEVSAAVQNWRDGKGNAWPDAILHVALTPLPVCGSQKGFERLSTVNGERPLFLSTMTRGLYPAPDGINLSTVKLRPGQWVTRGDEEALWALAEQGDVEAFDVLIRLGWVDRGPYGGGTKHRWWNDQTRQYRYQTSRPGIRAERRHEREHHVSSWKGVPHDDLTARLVEHHGEQEDLTDAEKGEVSRALAMLRKYHMTPERLLQRVREKAGEYAYELSNPDASLHDRRKARRKLFGLRELVRRVQAGEEAAPPRAMPSAAQETAASPDFVTTDDAVTLHGKQYTHKGNQWVTDNPVYNMSESTMSALIANGVAKRAGKPLPRIPRVTNDEFVKGGWDMAHAGLGSELVVAKMAEGMKGIEGREYGIREHSPGKWQLVSKPQMDSRPAEKSDLIPGGKADDISPDAFPPEKVAEGAKVESEHTSDPAKAAEIARDHLAEDPDYYPKLKKMEGEQGKKTPPADTPAEFEAAAGTTEDVGEPPPPKDETPRETAERKTIKESDENYSFARKSAVPNSGEDLLGSARHKRNAWRGLSEAEKDGSAEGMVTRDNLLKAEPPDILASISDNGHNSLAALTAHLCLQSLPKAPDPNHKYARSDKKTTPEEKRKQFYDAYMELKKVAEEAAKTEVDPSSVVRKFNDKVAEIRQKLRSGDGNHYNFVANLLVATQNNTAGRGKTSVMGRMNDFIGRAMKAYPDSVAALSEWARTKKEDRKDHPDILTKIAAHAKDVMEGDSFNKTFGTVSTKNDFNPAALYTQKARRTGGKKTFDSHEAAVSYMEKTLGMRGLQWGNSVTDSERQHHSKLAAEALADLSEILDLPPDVMSLSGKLGFAIGARGHGNALAHYEPDKKIINLTRKSGVGSLAHEWGHFFDHLLAGGKWSMEGGDYFSENVRDVEAWNPETRQWERVDLKSEPFKKEYAGLRDAFKASGFSKRLDSALGDWRRKKGMSPSKAQYWRSLREQFARTFERYVQKKLKDAGRENTYLAGVGTSAHWSGENMLQDGSEFWPTDAEVDAMTPAFDALFKAFRENRPAHMSLIAQYLSDDGKVRFVAPFECRIGGVTYNAGDELHDGHLDILGWEASCGSRYSLSLLQRLGWIDRGRTGTGKTRWWNDQTHKYRYQIARPGLRAERSHEKSHHKASWHAVAHDDLTSRLAEHHGEQDELTDTEHGDVTRAMATFKRHHGATGMFARIREKAAEYAYTLADATSTPLNREKARRKLFGLREMVRRIQTGDLPPAEKRKAAKKAAKDQLESVPLEFRPTEPGFTGTTGPDALGRIYHWVDGVRTKTEKSGMLEEEVNADEDLETSGGRSEGGGLSGKQLGEAAGESSSGEFPGPGDEPGSRDAELPDGDGIEGDRSTGQPDGTGNGLSDGDRVGDAGTAAGEGGGAGSVGEGGRDDDNIRQGEDVSGNVSGVESVYKGEPTPENPTDISTDGNWHYHSPEEIGEGGPKGKFRNNIAALRTLKAIELDGRNYATPEEQAIMAKFVGWGAFSQKLFQAESWDVPEEWQEEYKTLKGLLTEEEWSFARNSTSNAHFTHPDVVKAHWDIAQRLGFRKGRYLETSAGIGYYLGMMPPEIAGQVRTSAIELDKTTGRMLKLLYPSANVEVRGFQDHPQGDNFYDLIASNVPFARHGVADPRYDKYRASLHDYFFLKSMDLVRPGGLVMHVTSPYTMDKERDVIRRQLAEQADLVGAIRFPGGAHADNAGTQVVTDMLIFRKRLPSEPKPEGDPEWLKTAMVPDPDGGAPIEVNQYFANHPEQILGRLDRSGSMRAADQANVSMTEDYHDLLAAAIERLPKDVMTEATPDLFTKPPVISKAGMKRRPGVHNIEDGKLVVDNGDGTTTTKDVDPEDLDRIKGMIGLRDLRAEIVALELTRGDASAARKRLNEAYDDFVKKYGVLDSSKNRKLIADDPELPRIMSLEKRAKSGVGAVKADIFSKETVRPIERATSAADVPSALGISLHESAGIDVDRMASLVSMGREEVERHLVENNLAFNDPSAGWKHASEYLSGNVREKLIRARAAAQVDHKYLHNVKALEAAQPADLEYDQIGARMGAAWIPPSDYKAFAAFLTKRNVDKLDVRYNDKTGEWYVHDNAARGRRGARYGSIEHPEWTVSDGVGNQRANFMDLFTAAITGKSVIIKDRVAGEKPQVNVEATEAAALRVGEMRELFAEWVWEDPDRAYRLHRHYNDNFNNIVPHAWNGQHLQLPGIDPGYELHSHIKDFAWQVISTGGGFAAHEVGTGKTNSMIVSAMELRRLGLARKPMIACKKANIEGITEAARRLYPNAKILTTVESFDAKSRKETAAQIATGDYDLVIMTHEHIGQLPVHAAIMREFIQEELNELEASYEEAVKNSDGNEEDPTVKQLNEARASLETKLQRALDEEGKDDAVFFDELGLDHIFLDEAQDFKNLPIYSRMDRMKGVPTSKSNRAIDMLMRVKYLQKMNNGRGATFLTGTPIGNTMAEMYIWQKFMQSAELKKRGIDKFDAWANTFGESRTAYEKTVTGEYKPVKRFAKYTNLPELRQISGLMMDVRRADSMVNPDGSKAIIRPKRTDHVEQSAETPAMKELMASLVARAHALGSIDKSVDNMLAICTDGRKGSIDMRLLNPSLPDDPNSKTNKMIANVLRMAKENPGRTQLIFSDVGVNAVAPSKLAGGIGGEGIVEEDEIEDDAEGGEEGEDKKDKVWKGATRNVKEGTAGSFHLYKDIIDKLVAGGIPRDKIADFSKLKGAKKEKAQEALRRGEMLIGLGSTGKLGTGVNVQDKLMALHHLDAPWRPMDIEQRDGRGWRQGNMNDPTKPAHEQEIHIHRYVTEKSLDEMFWQVLDTKAKFIGQYMDGNKLDREIKQDDDTLSYEQIQAAASGNPLFMERVQVSDDVRRLERAEARHKRDQIRYKREKDLHERSVKDDRDYVKTLNDSMSTVEGNEDGGITIGDKTFQKGEYKAAFEEFAASEPAILESMKKEARWNGTTNKVIGNFRGLPIVVSATYSDWAKQYAFRSHVTSPDGKYLTEVNMNMTSLTGVPNRLKSLHKEAASRIDGAEQSIETIDESIGKEFKHGDQLAAKRQRLKELNEALIEESGGDASKKPIAPPPSSGGGVPSHGGAATSTQDEDIPLPSRMTKKKEEPDRSTYVDIKGNAYQHREIIKRQLGGWYDPVTKTWSVPADKADAVRKLGLSVGEEKDEGDETSVTPTESTEPKPAAKSIRVYGNTFNNLKEIKAVGGGKWNGVLKYWEFTDPAKVDKLRHLPGLKFSDTATTPTLPPMSAVRKAGIHSAIKSLADANQDYARERNAVGYNSNDTSYGMRLAQKSSLSDAEAYQAAKMLRKYHRQLGDELMKHVRGEDSEETTMHLSLIPTFVCRIGGLLYAPGTQLHVGHVDVLDWEARCGSRYALSLMRRLGWDNEKGGVGDADDSFQLSWARAQSRSGHTKWIGAAEHAGMVRYQESQPGLTSARRQEKAHHVSAWKQVGDEDLHGKLAEHHGEQEDLTDAERGNVSRAMAVLKRYHTTPEALLTRIKEKAGEYAHVLASSESSPQEKDQAKRRMFAMRTMIGRMQGKAALRAADGSFFDESQISKTAMDYAEHLIGRKKDEAKPEPKKEDSTVPPGVDPEHAPIVDAIHKLGGPDELTVNKVEDLRRQFYAGPKTPTPGKIREIADAMKQSNWNRTPPDETGGPAPETEKPVEVAKGDEQSSRIRTGESYTDYRKRLDAQHGEETSAHRAKMDAVKDSITSGFIEAIKAKLIEGGHKSLAKRIAVTNQITGRVGIDGRSTKAQDELLSAAMKETQPQWNARVEAEYQPLWDSKPKHPYADALHEMTGMDETRRHAPAAGTPERAAMEREAASAPKDDPIHTDLKIARLQDMIADPSDKIAGSAAKYSLEKMRREKAKKSEYYRKDYRAEKSFSDWGDEIAQELLKRAEKSGASPNAQRAAVREYMDDPTGGTLEDRIGGSVKTLGVKELKDAATKAARDSSIHDAFGEGDTAYDSAVDYLDKMNERLSNTEDPEGLRKIHKELTDKAADGKAKKAERDAKETADEEAAIKERVDQHKGMIGEHEKTIAEMRTALKDIEHTMPADRFEKFKEDLDDTEENLKSMKTGKGGYYGDALTDDEIIQTGKDVATDLARFKESVNARLMHPEHKFYADSHRRAQGLKGERGTIKVKSDRNGEKDMDKDVTIYGDLAVDDNGMVTHIPTGLGVAGMGSPERGKQFVEMAKRSGFDWTFKDFNRIPDAEKQRMKEFVRAFNRGDVPEGVKEQGDSASETKAADVAAKGVERDGEGNARGSISLPDGGSFQGKWREDIGKSDEELKEKAIGEYYAHLQRQEGTPRSHDEAVASGKAIKDKVVAAVKLNYPTPKGRPEIVGEYPEMSGYTRQYRVEPRWDNVSGVHWVGVYSVPEKGIESYEITPKHESYDDAVVDLGQGHFQSIRDSDSMVINDPAAKKARDAVKEKRTKEATDAEEKRQREVSAEREKDKKNVEAEGSVREIAAGVKGKRGKAELSLGDGKFKSVEGTVYGPFIVHKNDDGKGYTVTHIGTSLAVIPSKSKMSRENAILAAVLLGKAGNWNFSQASKMDNDTGKYGLRVAKFINSGNYADLLDHLNAEGIKRLGWVRSKTRTGKPKWIGVGPDRGKAKYQEGRPGGRMARGESGGGQYTGSEAIGMDNIGEHLSEVELTDAERQQAVEVVGKLRERFGSDEKVSEHLLAKAEGYVSTAQASHATEEARTKARRRLAGVAELLAMLDNGEGD